MDLVLNLGELPLCQKCGEGFIVPMFQPLMDGKQVVLVGWACTSCELSVLIGATEVKRTPSLAKPKE